jgi:hypothetical protein
MQRQKKEYNGFQFNLKTLSATRIAQRRVAGWLVNNELENIWKEGVMV